MPAVFRTPRFVQARCVSHTPFRARLLCFAHLVSCKPHVFRTPRFAPARCVSHTPFRASPLCFAHPVSRTPALFRTPRFTHTDSISQIPFSVCNCCFHSSPTRLNQSGWLGLHTSSTWTSSSLGPLRFPQVFSGLMHCCLMPKQNLMQCRSTKGSLSRSIIISPMLSLI